LNKNTIYKVVKYDESYYDLWNDFVDKAKNGTFLFHRDFMEYHKDRFEDFSLLIYSKNKLIALLPANIADGTVYSHQGLTYGGLLLDANVKFRVSIRLFQALLMYLDREGVYTLEIKMIPTIYVKQPNDELLYLMFLLQAKLLRRDSLSVLNLRDRPKVSSDRIAGKKRGFKQELTIKEVDEFDSFWNEILVKNLQNKHQAKPVHSLKEITQLKNKFSNNIRQFNVYKNGVIVAGTTIFETDQVVHSQYISGNEDKNRLGSLDFLHLNLIETIFKDKMYFDFGTSNENKGLNVNQGLQYWKEGFGARMVTQDFYEIATKNHILLNTVFI